MAEETKSESVAEEEIREETLSPTVTEIDEQKDAQEEQPDRSMNFLIPSMVGQFAFGSPPTSALPEGAIATPQSEESQRYVNNTAPVLEMIDFHLCLGPMAHISPTARLIIGGVVLIGGVIVLKLPVIKQKNKDKKEKKDEEDNSKD